MLNADSSYARLQSEAAQECLMRNYPWCMSLCVTWLHRIGTPGLAARTCVCAYILGAKVINLSQISQIHTDFFSSLYIRTQISL